MPSETPNGLQTTLPASSLRLDMPPMSALASRTKCLLFNTPDSHATGNIVD
uniref:Uncharacterized protein n=1 Tax=Neisseria meningitidis alpha275 TaxID=295996 RepID=C6SL17_NEIME|nr:hypothetical protein predicted by Glimmer/Critica [Neisseria meningitidis alpha275]